MPPFRAHSFGGRVEVVIPSFITCHNHSSEISSFISVSEQIGQPNTHSRRFLTIWQMLRHQHCAKFATTKIFVNYGLHNSFTCRQFNNVFTCYYLMILSCEPIHSRNRGTTYACQRHGNPWCLLVQPHNADTTGIRYTVRDTALPYTAFILR